MSTPDATPEAGDDHASGSPVTVFWRPHCGFSAGLRRALDRAGLDYDARNIWEDEEAAATVRSVADGSETVPTVLVGDRALVNPGSNEVLAAVAEVAPEHLPEGWEPRKPGPVSRTVHRLLGG